MIPEKTLKSLLKRASIIGVPNELSVPVVMLFVTWAENSGLEWSISRFKSVKVDFIRSFGGLPLTTPWIAKKDNYFRGPLGGLQRWALRSEKNFKLAIQLLQVYTFFYSDDVTETQSRKFIDAVQSDGKTNFLNTYSSILRESVRRVFPRQFSHGNPSPLILRPLSPSRNEPHANGTSCPEGELTLECAKSFLDDTDFGRYVVSKYPEIFAHVLPGMACAIGSEVFEYPVYTNSVGKIGLIQEPGFKLRAVANPGRVYQQALGPLGDSLYDILKTLPWDCTHNQSLPFETIQRHLASGLTAHAVDLSNATDMFPFSLQYDMLTQMYHRHDLIELFYDLSRAPWRCDLVPDQVIQWKTGQPLGLYPSFAAFALCHGLVLYGLNGFDHNNKFFVLGDDVVILDEGLHSRYKSFLSLCGIPFSDSKTLSSDVLTEFGGKVITPNLVIPQLKWRFVSDDSFIDIAKLVGYQAIRLMRPRQRKVFEAISDLPDFLGGPGFNPRGVPLDVRVQKYLTLFESDNLKSYLLGYNSAVDRWNYEPRFFRKKRKVIRGISVRQTLLPRSWYIAMPLSSTMDLDQRSLELLSSIPLPQGNFALNTRVLGDLASGGFPWKSLGTYLYHAFPRERCLQIEGSGRLTTNLEKLESKLF